MSFELETAANRESLRRVAIDPVSRVEGHGKVTLLLDEAGHVREARLHIVEFRGFEKFIQGRPYWEVPVMVQRLCGICPVSHHLAAAKALDPVVGAVPVTPTADKIRRLMHYGQLLQSHALHFFHLSSPDLLFGFESPVQQRNIVGVAGAYPEVARQGVLLRKFGQEVIRITAGKRVHGTGAIPGGVNKSLSAAERDELLKDADQMIQWSRDAVHLARRLHETNGSLYDEFGLFRSHLFSIVRADGALDLYDGKLRLRDARGQIVLDQLPCADYDTHITEEVKPWSYMKFPFITELGAAKGWYKVGPLARVQNCDFIPSPLAELERQAFVAHGEGEPIHAPLAYHWARMIEMLHAAEVIRALLDDPDLLSDNRLAEGPRQREGVGIIEAPRGTLIHHYRVGDDAFGPLLMAWLEQQARPGVQLVGDFQLQIEHALDLEGHPLALFIDAGTGTPAPFDFRETGPAATRPVSSHALAPEAVLQVYADIQRRPPPPAFVLCVRGEGFGLGEGLSPEAERNLAAARSFLGRCLDQADPAHWRRLIGSLAAPAFSG